jgi:hypothetical protein
MREELNINNLSFFANIWILLCIYVVLHMASPNSGTYYEISYNKQVKSQTCSTAVFKSTYVSRLYVISQASVTTNGKIDWNLLKEINVLYSRLGMAFT